MATASRISGWIHTLLSANLADDHPDVIEARQIRTLNLIVLFVILISAPLIFHYIQMGIPWMSAGIALAIVIALVILVYLRKTHNHTLCAHLVILDFAWIILLSNSITGGFYDTNFAIFYTLPVLAAFMLGIKAVFIYLGLTLLIFTIFFSFSEFGIEVPNLIPEDKRAFQSLVDRLFVTSMLALISIGFLLNRNFTEKLLQEAHRKEENLHQAKSRFFANMSHEIRTPLNSVIGLTQMLEHSNLTDEQETFVKSISRSGNTLLTVINDILDYSLIESGKLSIKNKDFELHQLLQDLCEYYNNYQKSGVSFSFHIASDVPQCIQGDAVRLHQVLSNLLNNAFKFTNTGNVALSVDITPSNNSPMLVFKVTDTGIGIPEKDKDKLFDAFHQVESHNQNQLGGTGLGLSICKLLIDLMQGSITLSSEVNKGTAITFSIPYKEADCNTPQPKASLTNSMGNANLKQLHVLVAEDNASNQIVIGAFLKKLGVAFELCENGAETLSTLQSGHSRFDVLLLDCEMPVMDGFEAAAAIRQWEKEHKMPPIFICAFTAHVFDETVQRCLDAGMNTFMTKPLKMETLVEMLNQAALADQPPRKSGA